MLSRNGAGGRSEHDKSAFLHHSCSYQCHWLPSYTDEVVTLVWCHHVLQPLSVIESLERCRMGGDRTQTIYWEWLVPDKQLTVCVRQDDWQVMLASLAELYVHGVFVNWLGFDRDYERCRLNLQHPFQRQLLDRSRQGICTWPCQNKGIGRCFILYWGNSYI